MINQNRALFEAPSTKRIKRAALELSLVLDGTEEDNKQQSKQYLPQREKTAYLGSY